MPSQTELMLVEQRKQTELLSHINLRLSLIQRLLEIDKNVEVKLSDLEEEAAS